MLYAGQYQKILPHLKQKESSHFKTPSSPHCAVQAYKLGSGRTSGNPDEIHF
jgi:hypothetical protein